MGNRTGTYVIFAAEGKSNPTETDMKYYRTLEMWKANDHIDFSFVNSHYKTAAVRDSSTKETLRSRLVERLNCSKNALLIIGNATRLDTDWVPFEIGYAIDYCEIPIIVAYPDAGECLLSNTTVSHLWPSALSSRITQGTARTMHVPFRLKPLKAAIDAFSHNKLPDHATTFWTAETYRNWGLLAA